VVLELKLKCFYFYGAVKSDSNNISYDFSASPMFLLGPVMPRLISRPNVVKN
jgi:hypothetical protein